MFKVQTSIGGVLLCFHKGCRVCNFLDRMDHVGYEFQNFQKIDSPIVRVIPPFTNLPSYPDSNPCSFFSNFLNFPLDLLLEVFKKRATLFFSFCLYPQTLMNPFFIYIIFCCCCFRERSELFLFCKIYWEPFRCLFFLHLVYHQNSLGIKQARKCAL